MLSNLHRLGPNAIRAACLTERSDCHVFDELRDNPSSEITHRFDITVNSDNTLSISPKATKVSDSSHSNSNQVHLLPGQQIITLERIEVLALNTSTRVSEGQSAKDTIKSILEVGGLPVVAWSPGKWFGKRGKVVSQLLDCFSPAEMALGDTTLRPYLWMTPLIMRKAKSRGFKILCGSDPLPFPGEENKPGSYASIIEHPPTQSPSHVIQNLLNSGTQITAAGKRGSLIEVFSRVLGNERVRNK